MQHLLDLFGHIVKSLGQFGQFIAALDRHLIFQVTPADMFHPLGEPLEGS